MKQEEVTNFLDQYTTKEEGGTVSMKDDVSSFLDQYEQPKPEAPVDVPVGLTPSQKVTEPFEIARQPEEEFRPSVVTESVKKGFADFAAIPGYAVDLVNWPLYKLGITPEEPFGGSKMIRQGWQLLTGYVPQEPKTKAEKYAAKIGEFAGSSLVPMAAFTGKIAAAGASAKELAGIIGTEAASVVTGGVGAEFGGSVGEQVAGPEGRVTGELIGGVSLGMAPIYFKAAGATIWNSMKSAKTVATEKNASILAENTAKQQITRMVGDDPAAAKNLERSIALQQEIPGFKPSLAAATGSKGIAAQQGMLDTKSIESYNTALESVRKANEVIDQYYDDIFKLSGRPLTAPKVFRKTKQALKTQAEVIEGRITKEAERFRRQPTDIIGAKLRELRGVEKGKVRVKVNAAYDDLYKAADDLGIVDDASDLYALAQDFTKRDPTAFQRAPGVYAKMRDVFGKEIDPNVPLGSQKIMTSFRKLDSLSKEVSREYGNALKSGDNQSQYYLGQVRELINGKLSQFDDPIYGQFSLHKQAVDKFWLEEYHNVFRKGVGGKMPHETRWGKVTPDEKIVSKLVMQPGTSSPLDDFNKIYKDVPEAQVLLRDGIMDMFASKVINKGKIDTGEVRTFVNNYKEVFDKLPDLRNTFMNSDALTTALTRRQANVIEKTELFTNQRLSPYAKVAGFGSADDMVEAGLNDPKVMKVLVRSAKNQAEREDISTLVADHVLEKPDSWNYILKNETDLAHHFNRLGTNHFKHLKNIAEAQSVIKRYDPTSNTPQIRGVQDTFWEKTGTTFSSAVAQMRWALYYNKTGVYYPIADMGSKYFYKMRQGQIEKLMERSLYDPDLAKTMSDLSKLKTIDMKGIKARDIFSDLGMHAINNGIRAASVAAETEQ